MEKKGLAAGLLAGWLLCACALAEAPAPLTLDDLVMTLAGEQYSPGDVAQPLVEAMEAGIGPVETEEFDSCLFQGKDKEMVSSEMLLGTYPIGPGGQDRIETILVVGGEHATARGIRIGSSKQQVLDAYGSGYRQDYDELLYEVEGENTKPVIVFVLDLETDLVTSYYMMLGSG